MFQSRKRLRIFFKNLVFHAFHGSSWQLVHEWKVQLWGVHRDFRGLVRNSLTIGTSNHEKYLENFKKNFLSSVLAARPGNLYATWFSHKNRVFCAKMVSFLNLFSFPLNISDCSSSSLPEILSNSPCHSRTNLHFCFIQTSIFASFKPQIFKKKVWVFSLSLYISCFELCFLGFVSHYWVLWYRWFRLWVGFMFDEFGCLGLVDLASRMLNTVAFMFNFTIRACKLIYASWQISYPCLLVSLSYDICFVFLCDIFCLWVFLVQYGWILIVGLQCFDFYLL